MNAGRRKQLRSVVSDLEKIDTEIINFTADGQKPEDDDLKEFEDNLVSRVDDIRQDLDGIKDDEQDYYDNMPEGLQGGEKGTAAEEAVQNMQEVYGFLEELCNVTEPGEFIAKWREDFGEMTSKLEDAQW